MQPEPASIEPAGLLAYERAYGFSQRPFSLSTDSRYIYHSRSYDRAVHELVAGLGRRDGIMVLTGERGAGKTTLCRSLVAQLESRTAASLVTDSAASFEDLLQAVLADVGAVAQEDGADIQLSTAIRQELIAAVGDLAASLAPYRASVVIIVDEAQNVPADVLVPLSALADRSGGDRRVQIILVAQPTVPLLLQRPELRAVERRVTTRARLEPLTAGETIGYVVQRVAVAGPGAGVTFDEAALAGLYATTRGVPRPVNLVCDRALVRGHMTSASVIDQATIAAAAADLDLPPVSDRRSMLRAVTMAVVFLALMLVGAGAAAWVLRDDVARLVARWDGAPWPVVAPVPQVAEPAAPPR